MAKKQEKAASGKKKSGAESAVSREEAEGEPEVVSELELSSWAVVSFDGCVASDLTYNEAEDLVSKLDESERPGLCIVTSAAAGRITPGNLRDKVD